MIQHFYEIAHSTHQDELSRATQRINEQIERSISAKVVYEGMIRMNRAYARNRSYNDATDLITSFFRCDQKIAADILQIYMTSDFDVPEIKVVPVLAVTLVEVLLNDILVDLLVKHRHVSTPDGRREVATLGSFDKRYTLFATLTGSELPAILQKIEKPFWDSWVYIRRKRNYFVHGNPYALGWNACARGFMLTLRSVATFAQLNNQFGI